MISRAPASMRCLSGAAALLFLGSACAPRIGATCDEDSDCGGDLVCSRPPPDGGAEGRGVCAPPPTPLGGRCTTSPDCAAGLFCPNALPAADSRRHGECIPVHGLGQECFRAANCAAGLECRKVDSEIGTCESPEPADDAGTTG